MTIFYLEIMDLQGIHSNSQYDSFSVCLILFVEVKLQKKINFSIETVFLRKHLLLFMIFFHIKTGQKFKTNCSQFASFMAQHQL